MNCYQSDYLQSCMVVLVTGGKPMVMDEKLVETSEWQKNYWSKIDSYLVSLYRHCVSNGKYKITTNFVVQIKIDA